MSWAATTVEASPRSPARTANRPTITATPASFAQSTRLIARSEGRPVSLTYSERLTW